MLDRAIFFTTMALASGLIFLIQLHFFHSRPIRKSATSPTSFFELRKLASEKRLRTLTYLYALPFTALFVVAAAESNSFVEAGTAFVITTVDHYVGEALKVHIMPLLVWLKATPPSLNPFVVLLAALVVIATAHIPMGKFRELVLSATGLEARADGIAKAAAIEVLNQLDYDKAVKKLESAYGYSAPLPEELVRAPKHVQLAYRLLYFSQNEVAKEGFEEALASTLAQIGVHHKLAQAQGGHSINDTPNLTPGHLMAALVFYLVLCAFYIAVAPLFAWLEESALVRALLAPVEWARARDSLALDVIQHTLAFVAPLASGMYLYSARRAQYRRRETTTQSFGFVFSIQFMSSLLVGLVFYALFISKRSTDAYGGDPLSFYEAKVWTEMFMSALAPGAALLAWMLGGKWKVRGLNYVAACFVAALSFLLCRYAYEIISGNPLRGYYWHQMVLGAFLTLAYYTAALIAKDILLPPFEPEDEQQPEPIPALAEAGRQG